MTTKLTPAQIRFFLNASFSTHEGQGRTTLLDQFLGFSLPAGLRYRIEVLRRNLASSMAPVDVQVRELYEAYQAAIGDDEVGDGEKGGSEEKDSSKSKLKADDSSKKKDEAKEEAKRKFDEDLREIDNRPIEFTGKLILAIARSAMG